MAANTIVDVEMINGEILKMTLNFKNLYLLRNKDKKTYSEYMRISNAGPQDEMEVAMMLYTAYKCANLDQECKTFEDFIEILPVNREEVTEIALKLQPKKKQILQTHLKSKQNRKKAR